MESTRQQNSFIYFFRNKKNPGCIFTLLENIGKLHEKYNNLSSENKDNFNWNPPGVIFHTTKQ